MLPLASISHALTHAVADHGVWAVLLVMAVDALLPVGGEIMMVVAGALAAGAVAGHPRLLGHQLEPGLQTYLVLAAAGTIGYLVGSLLGWWLGRSVSREALARRGRLVHLGPGNLARAERWFHRHGAKAVLLGRLTPLVRSFVSIPAGLFGEPLGRYTLLTAAGSAVWCFGFAGLGWGLGSGYRHVDDAVHVLEALAVAALLLTVVLRWLRPPSES